MEIKSRNTTIIDRVSQELIASCGPHRYVSASRNILNRKPLCAALARIIRT